MKKGLHSVDEEGEKLDGNDEEVHDKEEGRQEAVT